MSTFEKFLYQLAQTICKTFFINSSTYDLKYDWNIYLARDCHFLHTRVGQVLFTAWSRSTQFPMPVFFSLLLILSLEFRLEVEKAHAH